MAFSVLSPPCHRNSPRVEPICEVLGLPASELGGELGPIACLRFVTASLKSACAKQLGFNKLAISEGGKKQCSVEAFPTSSVVTVFFFQELIHWQRYTPHARSPRVAPLSRVSPASPTHFQHYSPLLSITAVSYSDSWHFQECTSRQPSLCCP